MMVPDELNLDKKPVGKGHHGTVFKVIGQKRVFKVLAAAAKSSLEMIIHRFSIHSCHLLNAIQRHPTQEYH